MFSKKVNIALFLIVFIQTSYSYAGKLLHNLEERNKSGAVVRSHKIYQDSQEVERVQQLYGTTFQPLSYLPLPSTYKSAPKLSNADGCPYYLFEQESPEGIYIPDTQDCIVTVLKHTTSQQVLVFDVYRGYIIPHIAEILFWGFKDFKAKNKEEWENVEAQLVSFYHTPHLKKWVEFLSELGIKADKIKSDISRGAVTQEDDHIVIYLYDNLSMKDIETGKNIYVSKEGNLSVIPPH